jgi:glucosyl-3-phosphoglycerate synthase
MGASAAPWLDRNTHHWDDWSLPSLLAAKAGRVVSLVVPARNEAATVGDVVTRVREALVDTVALRGFPERHAIYGRPVDALRGLTEYVP